jgi:HlyD family secretion protein
VRVTRVDPQVKNATFQVDLAFEGAMPRGLLPGQALEGRLTLGGDRPALVLPAGAFLERTGGDWVLVADPDGATPSAGASALAVAAPSRSRCWLA